MYLQRMPDRVSTRNVLLVVPRGRSATDNHGEQVPIIQIENDY